MPSPGQTDLSDPQSLLLKFSFPVRKHLAMVGMKNSHRKNPTVEGGAGRGREGQPSAAAVIIINKDIRVWTLVSTTVKRCHP